MKLQRYGWRKDSLDHRDHLFVPAKPLVLPPSVDLRTSGFLPPVYDQGQLGSCTANALAAAVDFERAKQKLSFLTPSRLFVYYNERVMEGDTPSDAGAEIRTGIKTVAAQGVCLEAEWPYDIAKFAVQPSAQCYTDAAKFRAMSYSRVTQSIYYPRHCLAILGRPVVFGFTVFDAFESDQVNATGIVPMPGPSDQPIGGHAVCIVGYDDAKSLFLARNSWGSDWGQSGYFQIPYAYLMDKNLASDFWVILTEE